MVSLIIGGLSYRRQNFGFFKVAGGIRLMRGFLTADKNDSDCSEATNHYTARLRFDLYGITVYFNTTNYATTL